MANISIRRAYLDDRPAVIDGIGSQFGGFDYLDAYYVDFVTNPDFLCFVAVDGNEVVGFYSAHVIDGGQTICKRGGRVKESHQNQGIFTKLSTYIDQQVAIHWPTVKWETFVTLGDNANRVANGFIQKKGFKEILRMDGPLMTIDVASLPIVDVSKLHHLVELTQKDMDALLSEPESCSRLFTRDRFMAFLVPLRCMKENTHTFFNGKSYIVASMQNSNQEYFRNNDSQQNNTSDVNNNKIISFKDLTNLEPSELDDNFAHILNKSYSNENNESRPELYSKLGEISLISLATHYTCVPGLRYHIDLLGSDYTDIESHLRFHLHRLQTLGHNTVHLSLEVIPEAFSIAKQASDRVFGQHGNIRNRYYFERDFKQL